MAVKATNDFEADLNKRFGSAASRESEDQEEVCSANLESGHEEELLRSLLQCCSYLRKLHLHWSRV